MAVLQIIYLAINAIGMIVGLVYFCSEAECNLFSNIFTLVQKYFKNAGVIVFAILLIGLLLPALTFMSVVVAFTMICGTYLN